MVDKVEKVEVKQEAPVAPEAPPSEGNPMAMVMRALEEMKAMLAQLLEGKGAPMEAKAEETPAAPPGGKPGEVRVSFKSDPEFVKAVQEIIDANKVITKSADKPSQNTGGNRGSLIAEAIEKAKSATSAKDFFERL